MIERSDAPRQQTIDWIVNWTMLYDVALSVEARDVLFAKLSAQVLETAASRDAVLEEAARICEAVGWTDDQRAATTAFKCAVNIRALKTNATGRGCTGTNTLQGVISDSMPSPAAPDADPQGATTYGTGPKGTPGVELPAESAPYAELVRQLERELAEANDRILMMRERINVLAAARPSLAAQNETSKRLWQVIDEWTDAHIYAAQGVSIDLLVDLARALDAAPSPLAAVPSEEAVKMANSWMNLEPLGPNQYANGAVMAREVLRWNALAKGEG